LREESVLGISVCGLVNAGVTKSLCLRVATLTD
jgi:hypothetical protein